MDFNQPSFKVKELLESNSNNLVGICIHDQFDNSDKKFNYSVDAIKEFGYNRVRSWSIDYIGGRIFININIRSQF